MQTKSEIFKLSAASIAVLLTASFAVFPPTASAQSDSPDELSIMAGKSAIVRSEQVIERVSVGYGDVAEAMAVGAREVLVNAKSPGSTSLIVWQMGGGKLFYDVKVRPNQSAVNDRVEGIRRELRTELPGQEITPNIENDAVFLRGTAKDLTSVQRAVSIASTAGRVVNLLYVNIPAPEAQILLKVRFASVDRSNVEQLGMNLFSTGATNTIGSIATQQYPSAQLPQTQQGVQTAKPFVFSDILNVFLFRPDLNLGAAIKALEAKNLLEVLAEPNVLAQNGKQGSFLAGGEFPYPVVQGSNFLSTVTIQFREFGVRLNFIPTITPGGNIRLQVAPEVSSLDYSNGITLNGFNVPGLISRKVNTEVELQQGQSFAIGGLLDRRVTDSFEKVPFIGDVPILGKFFRSKNTTKNNTELIVIVTPEIVTPGVTAPAVPAYPKPFLDGSGAPASNGGSAATIQPAAAPAAKAIPVEQLLESMKAERPLDTTVVNVKGEQSPNLLPLPASTSSGQPATVPQISIPH